MKLFKTKSFKTLIAGSMLTLTLAMPLQAMAESKEAPLTVPLRTIAESIGAKVTWDPAKQQATVLRGGLQFTVTIGGNTAIVNGKPVTMSGNATTIDERMTVPLDALEEALQINVDWHSEKGLAIDSNDVPTLGSYFVHLLLNGQFPEARTMMNEKLQGLIPEALMPVIFNFSASPYGALTDLVAVQQEQNKVHNNALLTYTTDKSIPLQIDIRFDDQGKVDDIYIEIATPSNYQKPIYDKADQYKEEEVVVGKGATAVPGTLTLPKGDGPFPSVVLVHGSGPSDRDETVGGYKTFRDLAVGLAAKGIAVLRYEKQTHENPISSAMNPKFTVQEESVDDALQAISLLQSDKRIDNKRVFVIGHSQGGMLVPRIIEQDKNQAIAGTIIMSSPNQPLEDVLTDQMKAGLDRLVEAGQPEEVIAVGKQQIAAWEQQVKILKDPQYSVKNIPSTFTMPNAYWWFDFRDYYAGNIAKTQAGPLLILQGENDMQVLPDQLDSWKKALSARKDVTYKSYPKLNHFYVSVDQPSTGEEYNLPGNVPANVIDDIATWLLKQK